MAGVLVGPISFANPYLGETYGIYGFIALMIGGIERPAASMGGGFVLGILATLASTYINPQASDWFPFVVVLAVLLVTPKGILRVRRRTKETLGHPRAQAGHLLGPGGMTTAAQLASRAPEARPGRSARGALWAGILVAYLIGTGGLAHSSSYEQGLLLVAAVYSILALSLDLVAGATGLYSLGHAGLFAIGAYGTTILSTHYGWNIFLALPITVLAVGVVGVIIGALSLRVSGLYFAITTLIFTIIVNVAISDLNITGGYTGLASPPFPNFPHALSFLGSSLAWAVCGALLITVTLIWSIRSSALYPALLAIRDCEPFASSVGVRTSATRVAIFSLSAALAGLAGWTFSFLGFITPGQFDSTASVNILVMVILGGMNTRTGPIFGAVFISLFPTVVSMNPLWQEILFGSIFLCVIVFFPEGFVGLLARAGRALRARWRSRPGAPLPSNVGAQSANGWGPAPNGAGEAKDAAAKDAAAKDATAMQLQAYGAPAAAQLSKVALEARGITFSYVKGVKALDNVDFVVERGSIHGLIGPNGSGKSTLVNLLSGELSPQEGTICINGERIERLPAWQRPARWPDEDVPDSRHGQGAHHPR